jgi:two-component system sensor histidine kinase MprB
VTLGRRVVLVTSAAVAMIAVLLSVFAYLLVRHELYRRLDATLREREYALSSQVQSGLAGRSTLPVTRAVGEVVQVLRADGRTIVPRYQAAGLPSGPRERAVAAGGDSFLETVDVRGARMRVLTAHLASRYALQVARSTADEQSTLHRLRISLGLLALSALIASLLHGDWIAQTALAPVRRLTRAAERVAETRDLSLRLDEEGKDEVARLGAAFNQMLAALERSLTAQRQLVADASHEFRTPLTSIRANAELLARGSASDGEAETIARQVVEQVDELDGLVGDVIELALDGEAETRLEDVRLDEIVTDQVERMRRYAAGVRFDVANGPSTVRGDPERLQRAVANVLANAVRWSPPDGVVDVGVARGVVTVRDHGPGIDEADLPFVFERFYRAAAARGTQGSGLGLAIVRHVAEACGGTAEASNAPGGGAVVTLRLPESG